MDPAHPNPTAPPPSPPGEGGWEVRLLAPKPEDQRALDSTHSPGSHFVKGFGVTCGLL